MGTILLLDVSLSLLQAVDPDASEERNRKDLMQIGSAHHEYPQKKERLSLYDLRTGILHFLQRLKKGTSPDAVAVYEFSRECKRVLDFTQDYSAVRRRVYQMTVSERSLLGPALEKVVNDIAYTFESGSRVNVVLFTDGRLVPAWSSTRFGSEGQPVLNEHERLCEFVALAFSTYSIQLSIVCFGCKDETMVEGGAHQRLAQAGGGGFYFTELPATSGVFKRSIDRLCMEQYPMFSGIMELGTMNFSFELIPDPHTRVIKSIGPDGQGSLRLGQVISVVGFIPSVSISCPAITSRHAILHESLRIGDTAAAGGSLYSLLFDHLKKHNLVALVQLCGLSHDFEDCFPSLQWFGVVRALSRPKCSQLVLDILKPNADIPWLGAPHRLSTHIPDSGETELGAEVHHSVPLVQRPEPSYCLKNRGVNLPSVQSDVVQRELIKIIKYARSLPDRLNDLYEACEALRSSASTMYVPGLAQLIGDILRDEKANPPDSATPEALQALQELIDQISTNGLDRPLSSPVMTDSA